ncbi:MAG TPA: hypothetical protein PLY23_04530, partial [Alphaproteobacteria bacterium]|nr:hypothetical protein [Alphaproteobacteria bacterium]HQS94019.1 hypothetical protein [Alphaproteobacteria bacterium]
QHLVIPKISFTRRYREDTFFLYIGHAYFADVPGIFFLDWKNIPRFLFHIKFDLLPQEETLK